MYNFKFADIGEGIHEGQIIKWLFKVGDKVKEGDTLCIVETDKVNAEIPSPVDGVITKLGCNVGDTIHVGETLVLIDDGSSGEEEKVVTEEKGSGVVGEIEVSDEVIASPKVDQDNNEKIRVLATPVARHLANDLGLDIKQIKGSGENGRVLKDDINNFKANEKEVKTEIVKTAYTQVVSSEGTRREPITKIRKTIANNMALSASTIPHVTMMDEYDVSKLVTFRSEQKDLANSQGVKLTYMAFIVKAVTKAIKDYPIFNASFDHEKEEIIYKDYINIGIAVDTKEGLMVPNIKNADQKSIFEIAKEIESLSKQANDRTIQLSSLQKGTFTITNYGAVDSLFGTPIINYPEVAIIGIGKIIKKPIVVDNELKIADIMPVSIAFDHRIIDGADAGRFNKRVKEYLSNPMLLLLS